MRKVYDLPINDVRLSHELSTNDAYVPYELVMNDVYVHYVLSFNVRRQVNVMSLVYILLNERYFHNGSLT